MKYKAGSIRVAPYSDYEPGSTAFCIEYMGFWNTPDAHWAIPDWIEWGYGFDETYPTRQAAEKALADWGIVPVAYNEGAFGDMLAAIKCA